MQQRESSVCCPVRTPLLLMNGIGVNLEVLQPFVDALDPAIEVLRFDVPGTGGSPAPLIPYRFSAHARLAKQMLAQLGYKQVDVLGISRQTQQEAQQESTVRMAFTSSSHWLLCIFALCSRMSLINTS